MTARCVSPICSAPHASRNRRKRRIISEERKAKSRHVVTSSAEAAHLFITQLRFAFFGFSSAPFVFLLRALFDVDLNGALEQVEYLFRIAFLHGSDKCGSINGCVVRKGATDVVKVQCIPELLLDVGSRFVLVELVYVFAIQPSAVAFVGGFEAGKGCWGHLKSLPRVALAIAESITQHIRLLITH